MENVANDPLDALVFVPTSAMYVPAGAIPDADVIGEIDAPVVLHQINLTKGVDWFGIDRALLKASLLYADRAEVAGLTDLVGAARRLRAIADHYLPEFWPEAASGLSGQLGGPGLTWLLDEVGAIAGDGQHSYHELPPENASEAQAALTDFRLAMQAGALLLPDSEPWTFGAPRKASLDRDRLASRLADHHCLPVVGGLGSWPSQHDALEGALATSLLGELEGFPNASMDVILDVRQRLERPRIRFRAAIAAATRELASEGPRDVDAAIVDVRRRVVAPAIAEIQEELGALNVRNTLLRITSSPWTAGTLAAQLSLAAGAGGAGGLAALARGLLATPVVAALAKEADYRSTQRRTLRLRPYWILHQAAVEFSKRA
jgi:hypothetical protein